MGLLRWLMALSLLRVSTVTCGDHDHPCPQVSVGRDHSADAYTTAGSWIPGDWGWRRPQGSLAPCFFLDAQERVVAGCKVRLLMRMDKQCAARMAALMQYAGRPTDLPAQTDVEPFFLIRLVGPAIVMGEAWRHPDGHTWDVGFTAHRPGRYMMDVVVEFSASERTNTPEFYNQHIVYEGNAIPGSPFPVTAHPSPALEDVQAVCSAEELGRGSGEWVLNAPPEHPRREPVNFTAAGFSWVPNHCRMPDLGCLLEGSVADGPLATCLAGKRVALAMVGDSVMRLQAKSMAQLLGQHAEQEGDELRMHGNASAFDVAFQPTNHGLMARMPEVRAAVDALARCQHQGTCAPVLIFNSGLHDLTRTSDMFCGNATLLARQRAKRGAGLDCVSLYPSLLQEVVDYVEQSGFTGMKVFRTTTAAWLKWGNLKVNWFQKRMLQPFVTSWPPIVRWNELALDIFDKAEGWLILDGFQSSIGRPDHVESHPEGALVHFEREVPDAHNHQLLSIVVHELCPHLFDMCT